MVALVLLATKAEARRKDVPMSAGASVALNCVRSAVCKVLGDDSGTMTFGSVAARINATWSLGRKSFNHFSTLLFASSNRDGLTSVAFMLAEASRTNTTV